MRKIHVKSSGILIAGFGNTLCADDGFGVLVVRALMREVALPEVALPKESDILEVGISGMSFVQALMRGYRALIVVDAEKRGQAPGTLYQWNPTPDDFMPKTTTTLIDVHLAEPRRAIQLAKAVNALPDTIHIVGCEPGNIDSYVLELSDPVKGAIPEAVATVKKLISRLSQSA